jgi:chemotaxis protein methyltransferase CheR
MRTASASSQREFSFSDKEFAFLATLANKVTGIQLADNKRDMVYSRLVRRVRALHLESFADYCALLASEAGKEEMLHLVNAITTNLTHFFREAHHFEHLAEEVLQPLHKKGVRKLRIWSAGSSGMEPYSLAMTMRHHIPNLDAWDARILATDIDTTMLDKGVAGVYPMNEYSAIPKDYGYDIRIEGEQMYMSDDLRTMIAFKQLNLLESWQMKGMFDAIFCRNVVIYFDKDTQETLFARMAKLLAPHGFLYIGHSENITTIAPQFTLIGRTIYRHSR